MLEIRHLDTLIALAETGRLAKAAQRVHLTESAISYQIKNLEDHYGTKFFERNTSPLQWTPAGERLVALAYDVVRRINDTNLEIVQIIEGKAGQLRIAVECHSCFEWLMPSMDTFRDRWPQVEMDLVSGFHPDPVHLLHDGRADLIVTSQKKSYAKTQFHDLFGYYMPAIIAKDHKLVKKSHLTAKDFSTQTLITYPVPDERLDLVRQVLGPAKISPPRRTAMLTEAILQLVASHRGIAALPSWAIHNYLQREYVTSKPITKNGLRCQLYAAIKETQPAQHYLLDFIQITKEHCFRELEDIFE